MCSREDADVRAEGGWEGERDRKEGRETEGEIEGRREREGRT